MFSTYYRGPLVSRYVEETIQGYRGVTIDLVVFLEHPQLGRASWVREDECWVGWGVLVEKKKKKRRGVSWKLIETRGEGWRASLPKRKEGRKRKQKNTSFGYLRERERIRLGSDWDPPCVDDHHRIHP
ncbi:hypothetical protein RUM44_003570 [Polyplax serrata]|uniref:Uncharacterized protein n=1 Tax=Polyplax serrata TaxID=468196 RepID=A0ABR1AIH7_POLSC